jgi:hypothetical protein
MWVCLSVGCVDLEVCQTLNVCMKNQIKKSQKNKRNVCICVCAYFFCVCLCMCGNMNESASKIRDQIAKLFTE